jgi:hypothetical protein
MAQAFSSPYGFAPKVPDAPYGPGVIRDENQHPYDFETTYEISNEQYEAVRQFITNSINNPWDYSVHRANCSAWVNDALRAAGIHDPVSVSWHWLPNPYEHAIDIVARNAFTRAKRWTRPRDPIILDLDGNGLETVGLAANVYFDFDADGVLTKNRLGRQERRAAGLGQKRKRPHRHRRGVDRRLHAAPQRHARPQRLCRAGCIGCQRRRRDRCV